MRCLSAPASKFSTSSRSGLPQFACFRTATLCNPLFINDFHTLQKRPFATPVFSMVSTLFEKQRGVYPKRRSSGETTAESRPTVPALGRLPYCLWVGVECRSLRQRLGP